MVADITARIHAAGHEQRLAAIVESSDDAIISKDLDGIIASWNAGAERLYGYKAEEVLGKSVAILIPPNRVDEGPAILARLRQGEIIDHYETVRLHKSGRLINISLSVSPIKALDGQIIGASKVARDISDRKLADEYLQRLAAIVESSDDAIIGKNLDGIITNWNRGAQSLFGYSADEVIGKSITILIPPDRLDEETSILQRIRRGERVDHFETVRRRKDGNPVDISLTISPIKVDGRVVGASKIARDISERREAEKKHALLVSEFRHRLKNTIATVQAIASQTLRTLSRADRDAFFARLHALSGAHDLIAEDNWNQASMRQVVDRALDAFRDTHNERFDGDGPVAYLDGQRAFILTMALHELGTNAVKYGALSNASGRVHLAWELLEGDKGIRFRWWERGGPPVKPPEHVGFGSQLIRRALDGGKGSVKLEFPPEGVTCTLEIFS